MICLSYLVAEKNSRLDTHITLKGHRFNYHGQFRCIMLYLINITEAQLLDKAISEKGRSFTKEGGQEVVMFRQSAHLT